MDRTAVDGALAGGVPDADLDLVVRLPDRPRDRAARVEQQPVRRALGDRDAEARSASQVGALQVAFRGLISRWAVRLAGDIDGLAVEGHEPAAQPYEIKCGARDVLVVERVSEPSRAAALLPAADQGRAVGIAVLASLRVKTRALRFSATVDDFERLQVGNLLFAATAGEAPSAASAASANATPKPVSFNMPSPTTGSCRSRRRRRRAVAQTSRTATARRRRAPSATDQSRSRPFISCTDVLSGPARLAAPRPGITPRSATRLARRWRRASTIACCVPSPGWEEWSHGHCCRSARQCGSRRPKGRRCRPSSDASVWPDLAEAFARRPEEERAGHRPRRSVLAQGSNKRREMRATACGRRRPPPQSPCARPLGRRSAPHSPLGGARSRN